MGPFPLVEGQGDFNQLREETQLLPSGPKVEPFCAKRKDRELKFINTYNQQLASHFYDDFSREVARKCPWKFGNPVPSQFGAETV